MEVERSNTRGIAGAGLGLGIAGTALGLLNGGVPNILGGWGNGCVNTAAAVCSESQLVNRYEATQAARIAELETEVKLRDANTFTMGEIGKLRDYVEAKFDAVNAQMCQQAVINSQLTANISCMQGQIAVLNGLTKTVIPVASICPEVMPRYNSWTAPTTEAAAGG